MWRKRQVVATKTCTGQKNIEEEMSSWRWAEKHSRVWDLSEKQTEIGMPRKAVLFGRKFNLVLKMLISSESRMAKQKHVVAS